MLMTKGAVIIYDAAYEAYISEDDVPHSIYECDGAKNMCDRDEKFLQKCRIYRNSVLDYTVIPKELNCDGVSLQHVSGRDVTEPSSTEHLTSSSAPVKLFTVRGRKETDKRAGCILHEQCKDHPRGIDRMQVIPYLAV